MSEPLACEPLRCGMCGTDLTYQTLWVIHGEKFPLCDDRKACTDRMLENAKRDTAEKVTEKDGTEEEGGSE